MRDELRPISRNVLFWIGLIMFIFGFFFQDFFEEFLILKYLIPTIGFGLILIGIFRRIKEVYQASMKED